MAANKTRDSLVWGIILISAGAIALLEALHVRTLHYIWRFWPVIFIVWGASKLFSGLKDRGQKDQPVLPQDKGHEI